MKPLSAIMANEIVNEFIPPPDVLAHNKKFRRFTNSEGESMWVAVDVPAALIKQDPMDSSMVDFPPSGDESDLEAAIPSSSASPAATAPHRHQLLPSEAAPWGLHPPGVACVVAGTLNLLGEAFNPFEFLATGDAQFMAHYREVRSHAQHLRPCVERNDR